MMFNPSHYLLGCRFDTWCRLLKRSHFHILPEKLPQAALITVSGLLMGPVALLESAITARPAGKAGENMAPPVFVLGHWRSGTTYLQNILTRDPQFSWADPVSTATFPCCRLLPHLLSRIQKTALKGARPMDNMKYDLNLPIEDTFAVACISDLSIVHMTAMTDQYRYYADAAFVGDLPEKKRQEWRRKYDYALRKLTLVRGGRRLLLKSPDNTARVRELMDMYPGAQFINIYRDPYVTVKSTIYMFLKQMELLRLTPLPEGDFQELMEDTIIGIFKKMYTEYFALLPKFDKGTLVEVKYEDFVREPEKWLRYIYNTLGFEGYETALPEFRKYIESQKGYVKNKFEMDSRLRDKINRNLGFYFEHYGYPMEGTDHREDEDNGSLG